MGEWAGSFATSAVPVLPAIGGRTPASRIAVPRPTTPRVLRAIAESRLRYGAERAQVERVFDRNDGPYAGSPSFAALMFLARWADIQSGGRGVPALSRGVEPGVTSGSRL